VPLAILCEKTSQNIILKVVVFGMMAPHCRFDPIVAPAYVFVCIKPFKREASCEMPPSFV
jgi:hypothetical protein